MRTHLTDIGRDWRGWTIAERTVAVALLVGAMLAVLVQVVSAGS
jgi:hypothetical protein